MALNAGIEAATHDKVLLIDSDCQLTATAIRGICEGLEGYDFCKGKVIFDNDDFASSIISEARDYTNFNVPKTYNPFLGLRKSVAPKVGGYIFDSDIHWTEDADLNSRVKAAGISVNYLPNAVAIHPPLTLKQDLRSAFRYGIGKRIRVEKRTSKGIGNYFSRLPDVARKKGVLTALYMGIWSVLYTSGYVYQILRDPYHFRKKKQLP